MTLFYVLLAIVCLYMEFSDKVNTDNILNKIGLGLVIIGALIGIYGESNVIAHPNDLISFGALLHFICGLRITHKNNHRRAGDRKPV